MHLTYEKFHNACLNNIPMKKEMFKQERAIKCGQNCQYH